MPDKPQVADPMYVTVFGAGVAGLTAAHELVERGFRVQVWEPQNDDRFPERGCEIGGLARSQWSRVHWPEWVEAGREPVPRVGKKPYELRWTGEKFTASGARGYSMDGGPANGTDDWNEERVIRTLLNECDVENEETIISVSVRYRPGLDEAWSLALLDFVRDEFLKLILKFIPSAKKTPDGARNPDLVLERDKGGPVRFRFDLRAEKAPRLSVIKPELIARLEFFHRPSFGVEAHPIQSLPQKIYQVDGNSDLLALGAFGSDELKTVGQEIVDALHEYWWIEQIYVELYSSAFKTNSSWTDGDLELVETIRTQLNDVPLPAGYAPCELGGLNKSGPDRLDVAWDVGGRLVDVTVMRLAVLPEGTPSNVTLSIRLRVRERWLPGEHGYRFFPAFYFHLLDTMRRTPIFELAPKAPVVIAQERAVRVNPFDESLIETGRFVVDNIIPRPSTITASMNAMKPTVYRRFQVASLTEAAERFRLLVGSPKDGGIGFTPREVNRQWLKTVQYMTTCTARRKELESKSWFDYIEASTYTPTAQLAIKRIPKALVAMDAVESDARTMGSVGLQILLDQFTLTGYRDGALNGPTTTAWLDYWRTYLEAQGVEFIHGEIVGLDFLPEGPPRDGTPSGPRIWPTVRCYEPRYFQAPLPTDSDEPIPQPPLFPGYFVLALPVVVIQRLAADFFAKMTAQGINLDGLDVRDLQAAAKLPKADHDDADPGKGMRHFAGVQYYFLEDLYWVDGHIYFPDSPWGLTAISQTRRWVDRPDWEHGYRGLLSTIIGKWDEPGTFIKKPAWECSPQELAYEVWHEVKAGLQPGQDQRLPEPVWWHMDDSFRWKPEPGAGKWHNVYPYQIQATGLWDARPGDPEGSGCAVAGGVVLAGTYMKTHTRITSMEAANESARHAVNAILRDAASACRASPCDIFPIEEREIDDLEWAKEVDARLHARGLPHAMEILEADYFAAEYFRGGPQDPLNPMWFLERLWEFSRGSRGRSSHGFGGLR